MSGSTSRRRKHSTAVYRRRRLVLLLAVLSVAAGLVWLFVAQPWQGSAASRPSTPSAPADATSSSVAPSVVTPSESAAPEADTAAETAEPAPELTTNAAPCVAADLLIEAVTDQPSYAQGQNPQLSITLSNQSAADCTLNVGTSAQAFTVSSGSDVWWRSTDCQTEPSDMTVLLAAGQKVTSSAPLTWDRTRSSVDTCQGDRAQAPGGGATYRLSVAIGGLSSSNTAAFQLE